MTLVREIDENEPDGGSLKNFDENRSSATEKITM